jgi:hypothetical protein
MTPIAGLNLCAAHPRPAIVGLALALLLSACATGGPGSKPTVIMPPPVFKEVTPKMVAARETLTKMVALQDRLYRVASPLLIKNAELCKGLSRNLLGFTAKNKFSYPAEFGEAAQTSLGLSERLEVTSVLAGSGAARSGLRRRDGLLAAEGKALPSGPNAETQAAGVFGPLAGTRPAIKMTILRNGSEQTLTVPVTRACGLKVELGNSDNVNSYADGQRIMLTRGMVNLAQSDDELAFVIAKGMAHNILGHAKALRSSATQASIIDNLINPRPDLSMLAGSAGIRAMPREMDGAADRLALYLLVRGGYDIDGAARFWQNLAAKVPPTQLNGYTANHPATGFRIATIDKTVNEINARQAARKPLLP